MSDEVRIDLPPWGRRLPFLRQHDYRNYVLYGGRSGGKSHTIARSLVLAAALEPLRILCLREFMNSLAESAKETIEGAIKAQGLDDYYEVMQREIRGKNGTEFHFRGLSQSLRTAASIKSYEDFDIAWVEEAQEITEDSLDLLDPTIRKPGSQLIFTFNPQRATDIVYRLFVSNPEPPPKSWIMKVNYDDNPFTDEQTFRRIEYDRKWNEEKYRHIWLGEIAPDLGTLRVLLMRDLQHAVDLYDAHAAAFRTRRLDLGLDVADLGEDKNALAFRRGPLVENIITWQGSESMGDTARRADRHACEQDARALYYDSGGIGAGVRSYLFEMGRRPYRVEPIAFNEAVAGPDQIYDGSRDNRQSFFRRNAQMAWLLKMRLQNTRRLHDGDDVDPADCLFINPAILDAVGSYDLFNQLNQPTWDDGDGHRIKIEKAQDGESSPDMFDAVCLAFVRDSVNGLRVNKV